MQATDKTPKVIVIEPTAQSRQEQVENITRKKVAAYCRVSTEQEEQQNSYAAQVNYYTEHIKNNPEWQFAGVYADEGITGTSTKNREGFNRMMEDARGGKIDLLLVKSISRLARNTVDTLRAVRELRTLGVEVVFEKESLNSFDPRCEMILTIFSSLAQEESHSISENVKWGLEKRMAAGEVSVAYSHFLGYTKGADGKMAIVEEEAKVVRKIYRLFLDGASINEIAARLTEEHIPTPTGKTHWSVSTVKSILSNEKYKGSALLQKTFIEDFLTKKVIKNTGQKKQYYIEKSHPAIIEPEVFELVQAELRRRTRLQRQLRSKSPFVSKIICKDCGSFYGHKVQNSGSKYRADTWYCSHKYDGERPCSTPTVRDEVLREEFVKAINQILEDKASRIQECEGQITALTDNTKLEAKAEKTDEALDKVLEELKELRYSNTITLQDQNEYHRQYDELSGRAKALSAEIDALSERMQERVAKAERIREYVRVLEGLGEIDKASEADRADVVNCTAGASGASGSSKTFVEFSDVLFLSTVEKIEMFSLGMMTFHFINGETVSVEIRRSRKANVVPTGKTTKRKRGETHKKAGSRADSRADASDKSGGETGGGTSEWTTENAGGQTTEATRDELDKKPDEADMETRI